MMVRIYPKCGTPTRLAPYNSDIKVCGVLDVIDPTPNYDTTLEYMKPLIILSSVYMFDDPCLPNIKLQQITSHIVSV